MARRHLEVVYIALLITIPVLFVACGGESAAPVRSVSAPVGTRGEDTNVPQAMAAATSTTGSAILEERLLSPPGAFNAGVMDSTPMMAATPGEMIARAPADLIPTPGMAGGRPDTYPSESTSVNVGKPQSVYQSPLTAGQVDDNAGFSEYLEYLRSKYHIAALPLAVEQRLFVRVLDTSQMPVAGARVQLFAGQRQVFDGRTVSDGRVLFFPRQAGVEQTSEFRALITHGQQQAETIIQSNSPEQAVTLDLKENTGPVNLDIVFLMDATGSMGDELAELRATVGGIASRIEQLPGSSKPRLGLVAYRDQGDEYVTRQWEFTPDVQQFLANLENVVAHNGGDYPEDVSAGLMEAIRLKGWSDVGTGRHLRLVFLVGDAPPHFDYPNGVPYTNLLSEAVASGIKVFPIGASGLDEQGEYIFRQFAQVTQGQFVFLTYANGVGGAPGPATTHDVEDFTVRNLDNLVVNLVAGEVANQTGQPVQGNNKKPQVLPVQSIALLPPHGNESVGAWLGGAVSQLVSAGTGLWVLALVGVFFGTRWATQRARLAQAPSETIIWELGNTPMEQTDSEQARGMMRVKEVSPLATQPQAAHEKFHVDQPQGEPTTRLPILPSHARVRPS